MVPGRPQNLSLHDFVTGGRLSELTEVGRFMVPQDLINPVSEGKVVRYDIAHLPEWGNTLGATIEDIRDPSLLQGYFHRHGDLKVYVKPIPMGELEGCIVCTECKVYIVPEF